MKKEVPAILLELANKHSVDITDAEDRLAIINLHSAMRRDVDVRREHFLALARLIQGTEWEQQIYNEMISHITAVLKADSELGTDPYSQLFSDVPFLASLSLSSPIAAVAIIKEPALSKILDKLSDKHLADLYEKICCEHPDIVKVIFFELKNTFTTRLITLLQDRDDSPERLAKILSRILGLNTEFWNNQIQLGMTGPRWKDRILKQGNPTKQLTLLAESENAFTMILRCNLLPNYGRDFYPIDGCTLTTLAKKWPRTACYLIESFPKDQQHLGYIKELAPCLIQAANEHHLSSIEIYALLAATGLAAPEIPQDFQKAEELCSQLMKASKLGAVCRVATALAKGETESSFVGVTKGAAMNCFKNVYLAQQLFKEILANTTTEETTEAKRHAKEVSESPSFRFELGEYLQLCGHYKEAIALYTDILERVKKATKKINTQISDTSVSGLSAYSRLSIFTKLKGDKKAIEDIGPEALHRLGMVWTERLHALNKDPSTEPQCIFELAQHFFAKGNLDLSCRLLLSATRSDTKYWDEDLCFTLAVQFISVGNFDKAQALLGLIPPACKNFETAQNMLKFSSRAEKVQSKEDCVLVLQNGDEKKPLFSKADILEYAMPFYRKAKEVGHKEAGFVLERLETEYQSLTHPEQNLPKWQGY